MYLGHARCCLSAHPRAAAALPPLRPRLQLQQPQHLLPCRGRRLTASLPTGKRPVKALLTRGRKHLQAVTIGLHTTISCSRSLTGRVHKRRPTSANRSASLLASWLRRRSFSARSRWHVLMPSWRSLVSCWTSLSFSASSAFLWFSNTCANGHARHCLWTSAPLRVPWLRRQVILNLLVQYLQEAGRSPSVHKKLGG